MGCCNCLQKVYKCLQILLTLPAIFANIDEPCRSDGMVDMTDSKSVAGDCVRVQVSSPVSQIPCQNGEGFFLPPSATGSAFLVLNFISLAAILASYEQIHTGN